jgi:hypothetical protein
VRADDPLDEVWQQVGRESSEGRGDFMYARWHPISGIAVVALKPWPVRSFPLKVGRRKTGHACSERFMQIFELPIEE